MNKKLLSGLMSLVMLAGSGAAVRAETGKESVVSKNAVVKFVKNHKKVFIGALAAVVVVPVAGGLAYYNRENLKKGLDAAREMAKNKFGKAHESVETETETETENVEKEVSDSESESVKNDTATAEEVKAEAEAEVEAETTK